MQTEHTLESALTHLRGRGYVLDRDFRWRHPNVANEITDDDLYAVDFLFYEWDYGWIKQTLDGDEV